MNSLISKYLAIIHNFLQRGSARSSKIKKHILASLLIKGLSVLIAFILVPITLDYVDEEQYGVWLTLSSIIAWCNLFDVGLGHGLRNKLSEALAEEEMVRARKLVSSTYAIITIIAISLLSLFLLINPLLDWSGILNVDSALRDEMSLVALVTFTFFTSSFILNLIQPVFLAHQSPALVNLFRLVGNLLSLVIILILIGNTEGSLFNLAMAVGAAPVVVLLVVSFYFYLGPYNRIAPKFKWVDKTLFSDLSSLGFKFFLLGITGLIIFSTDNLIIVQIFGPAEVTPYQISFKYFSLITTVFTLVSVPFWSAYTEANVNGDIQWILRTNHKLRLIWLGLTLAGLFMLLVSSWFYNIWVPEVQVSFQLSLMMYLYVVALCWGNIFVTYINGVGKVRLQIITSLAGAVLNIPLSIFLAKWVGMGTSGIILASTICIGYGPILAPLQFKKLTSKTARGIWNK